MSFKNWWEKHFSKREEQPEQKQSEVPYLHIEDLLVPSDDVSEQDLTQSVQVLKEYLGKDFNRVLGQWARSLNEFSRQHSERVGNLEKKVERGFSERPTIVPEIINQVLEQIRPELERETRNLVPGVVHGYAYSEKGRKEIERAASQVITSLYTHLNSPEFQKFLREQAESAFRTVANEGFAERIFKEIRDKGFGKTGRRFLLTGALGGLLLLGSMAYYTSYVIERVKKETNLSTISNQYTQLTKALDQYSIRTVLLEDKTNNLHQLYSDQERELKNKAENSDLVEKLDKSARNFNERIGKSEKDQNERLNKKTDDLKNSLESELGTVSSKVDPLERNFKTLEKNNEDKWKSYEIDKKLYQSLVKNLEELTKTHNEMRISVDNLSVQYKQLQESKDKLSEAYIQKLDSYKNKLEELGQKIDNLSNQLKTYQSIRLETTQPAKSIKN